MTHDDDTITAEIRDGMARTLYLLAYADGCDRGDIDDDGPGSGGEWDDHVPSGAPDSAYELADRIIADTAGRNSATVADLYRAWDAGDPDRFGHCLACKALGHGVAPSDDVKPGTGYADPKVGHFEFYSWDF